MKTPTYSRFTVSPGHFAITSIAQRPCIELGCDETAEPGDVYCASCREWIQEQLYWMGEFERARRWLRRFNAVGAVLVVLLLLANAIVQVGKGQGWLP